MKTSHGVKVGILGILCILIFPTRAPAQSIPPSSVEGRLGRFAVDAIEPGSRTWKGRLVHFLNTSTGEMYPIDDPDSTLAALKVGEPIRATGRIGDHLKAGNIERISRPSSAAGEPRAAVSPSPTLGSQRTLLTLLNLSNTPERPITLNEARARLIGNENSVDRFIRENSGDKAWLDADFLDWVTAPISREAAAGSFVQMANAALSTVYSVTDITRYRRFIFIVTGEGMLGYAGIGTIGMATIRYSATGYFEASLTFVDSQYATGGVIAHEFGHNLGLNHASSMACIPESMMDPLDCGSVGEYGDGGDSMGDAYAYHHFSVINKSTIQWLDSSQIKDVSDSGEYVLDQAELSSGGIKALRVPLGKDWVGDQMAYWLEYRPSGGAFSDAESIQVRLSPYVFSGAAASPSTYRLFRNTTGSLISGRVTGMPDGTGVEGVSILVYDQDWNEVSSGQTDAQGRYAVPALQDGQYFVGTRNSKGYIDQYYPSALKRDGAVSVPLAQLAEKTDIDFALDRGGRIYGKTIRKSDGEEIEGVVISLFDSRSYFVASGTSNSAGYYSIGGLPGGYYTLSATTYQNYLAEYYSGTQNSSEAIAVSVTRGRDTNADFELTRGGAVSGRLTDKYNGTAISQAAVYVSDSNGYYVGSSSADASGHYSVFSLRSGTYYVRSYNWAGYADEYYRGAAKIANATAVIVTEGQETGGIDFALVPGGVISGKVVRESDGAGISGVYVEALGKDSSFSRSTTTDATGSYTIRGLSEETYNVHTLNSQGYLDEYYNDSPTLEAAVPLNVTTGAELRGIDFALPLGGSISGRVVRKSDGSAIQGVSILAYDTNYYFKYAQSDSGGYYRVIGMRSGAYYVATSNSKGFVDQYYPDTSDFSKAVAVNVVQGQETGKIDFALSESAGQSAAPAALQILRSSCEDGRCLQAADPPYLPEFAGATAENPFVDPYRGLRVEWLEKSGSGSEARVRIRLTFSGVSNSADGVIDFGVLSPPQSARREITFTNRSASAVTVGQAAIHGRHERDYSIDTDSCSRSVLSQGTGCGISVTFNASNFYPGPRTGEYGVLRIPLDDPVQSLATLDLWARNWFYDLAVTCGHEGNFVVGQEGAYHIQVIARGNNPVRETVVVKDILPDGIRYLSSSGQWDCSASGQEVTCSYKEFLDYRYNADLELRVAIDPTAAPESVNTVTVSAGEDPFPENNTATDATTVTEDRTAYCPSLRLDQDIYQSIAAANFGAWPVTLTFSAYDDSGNLIAGKDIRNPAGRILEAGEQLALIDYEIWGAGILSATPVHWFSVKSTASGTAGMYMAFDGAARTLDGIELPQSPRAEYVLPEISEAVRTQIRVVNSGWVTNSLTFRLVSGGGEIRAVQVESLGPRSSRSKSVNDLFPGATPNASDYLRVSGSSEFVAVESIESTGQWFRALAGADAGANTVELFAPQVAEGGGWATTLSVVNLDPVAGSVSVCIYDENGNQIGETRVIPILAQGKITIAGVNSVAANSGNLFSGYARIRSDGPRIAGSITFGDAGGSVFSSSLPLQGLFAGRNFVLNHVASDTAWFTGIALLNPQDSAITAEVRLLDSKGRQVSVWSGSIPAGHRVSRLATQFFPEIENLEIRSGSIRISTDKPALVVGLFGTTDLQTLSAIPAHPIP